MNIDFTVPGIPVPKARAADFVTSAGRRIRLTPEKTREWERLVAWYARRAMGARAPMTGPLAVIITVYVPIPASWTLTRKRQAMTGRLLPTSRPDLDNYAKGVLDAVSRTRKQPAICFENDSQVVDLSLSKRYSEEPRVVVRIVAWE